MPEPHFIDVGLALIEMQHSLGVKLGRFTCATALRPWLHLKNILLVRWIVPETPFLLIKPLSRRNFDNRTKIVLSNNGVRGCRRLKP